jgi:hypothetical protein
MNTECHSLNRHVQVAVGAVNCTVPKDYTLKNVVFWDVALCGSCVNRRFGGKFRLHLQGRKIRER